ncbi:glycosyltransferase [Anaeromyxobacter oryzisoli]|uniref:glycosyltransferase n=1 Tax=Anaeromyxobacter oryzisoli TaxID=2925408 RepID=UPI001F57A0E3|nr:glycosyltransferase [Anaeromyxobacter sp. SG63]
MTSLSVLVPVYNEQHLVATSLQRLEVLEGSPHLERVQVVVVDDASRDGSATVLRAFAEARGVRWLDDGPIEQGVELKGHGRQGKIEWVFLRHVLNGGKGRAIRTALAEADCELSVIHDADLEYHPKDLLRIVEVFVNEQADAVFGSRFAGGEARRALLFRHELGNRLLTFLTNWVTNVNLTDMETCYKAVRTDLLKSIPIVSNDFRLEPELTIKLAKREARIFEVPISYAGRTYQEGKKINWRDGFKALWAILRFALSDEVYAQDAYGSQILGRLARAPRFNAWMADTIRPFCGQKVLEIGSGTGNLTRRLVPRDTYVASDVNPLYLQTLNGLTVDRPYLEVTLTDVTKGESFPQVPDGFDTVVCLNVIEHVDDDRGSLENIRRVLARNGKAIILVPHGPGLLGTLDEVLGHRRRYTEETLRQLAADAGFDVLEVLRFNRVGWFAWWLNGKVLRRHTFGLGQILMLNVLTPIFRLVDKAMPFPPLSLIAILRPSADAAAPEVQVAPGEAAAPDEATDVAASMPR